MSVSKAIQKRAIGAVMEVNPGARDFQPVYSLPNFLNGQLVVVSGIDADGRQIDNHVYLTSNSVRVAKNPSHFAHLVAEEARRRSPFAAVLDAGGIAGVIAVIITLTICYMLAIVHVTDVPAVLSTSLTSILGFYFGTKVGRGKVSN
jgi:hypothetical protein